MTFKEFIGIDVSKSQLDVFIYSKNTHAKFENGEGDRIHIDGCSNLDP
mgnify:CR=1 FL=1